MFNYNKGLTRAELRAALRAVGIRVSEVQLEQWHKKGLISRPEVRSLGRAKGRESRYPFLALPEAAMVAVMRRRVGRLDLIGWYLWCFGFPGHTPQAKVVLRRVLKRRLQGATGAMEQFERELPGNPIDRAGQAKLRGLMGHIRREVGREFMPSLERWWTEIELGRTEWIEGAEPGEFAQLLGVSNAIGMGSHTAPDVAEDAIRKVGLAGWRQVMHGVVSGLEVESLLAALERVDDRTMERLRDELQTMLTGWAGLLGRDTLFAQPNWFLLYFALRYVSPTWRPALHQTLNEMHRAGQLPTPLPPPWVQLVRQLRAEAAAKAVSLPRSSRTKP